jgi:hypothetical protein
LTAILRGFSASRLLLVIVCEPIVGLKLAMKVDPNSDEE